MCGDKINVELNIKYLFVKRMCSGVDIVSEWAGTVSDFNYSSGDIVKE